MQADWSIFKAFASDRGLSIQWVDLGDSYLLGAFAEPFHLECSVIKESDDCIDFETNFKALGNRKPTAEVVTQYEKNDKTLKLCRASGEVNEGGNVTLYFKVPGQFGSEDGRYVAGGYGIAEDYDKDDYVIVRVEDKDRIIAWLVAQSIDPEATEPVSDEMIQQMGPIPGFGEAFTAYPMIRSYTDEEADDANKGWYFWPLAQGNNLPAVGEIEVNPIGGYGFIPAGFYVKLIYQRPEGKTTGSFRANIDWGKKE